jgi:ParB family chromosome partitioning protein
VLDLVEQGKLSTGHVRALIGRDDAVQIAEIAVSEGLSVRDVETLARKQSRADSAPTAPKPVTEATENADILAVQQHLEEFLGLGVKIRPEVDPRKGTITIRYTTLDQLDLVCQRLTGGEF